MSALRDAVRAAKASRDWSKLASAIPYAQWLGVSVAVVDDELVCSMRFDPKLIGNATIPALHGGTLGGLLESTAAFLLLYGQELVALPKVINVTVDYLRSARPVDTHATGVITKQGRRVTNVRAFAWQEDRNKPVATVNAHFLVQPPDDG